MDTWLPTYFYITVEGDDIQNIYFYLSKNGETSGYYVTSLLREDNVVHFGLDENYLTEDGLWLWFAGVEDSNGDVVYTEIEGFTLDTTNEPTCTEPESEWSDSLDDTDFHKAIGRLYMVFDSSTNSVGSC